MIKPTPPQLPGLPLIGHIFEFRRDRQGLFRRGLEELGRVFTIQLGTRPAAVLIGPEYHKIFFMETDKKLSIHKTYQFLTALFGRMAFTTPPQTYFEQRPILHTPFKRSKMAGYVQVMQQEVQGWLDSLGDEGEMEIGGRLTALLQSVTTRALMGDAFHHRMGREIWDLYAILSQTLDPSLSPHLPLANSRRWQQAKIRLQEMLRPVIAERRANPGKYDDFLQDFVGARYKDGRKVGDETILGLILGLMFAGHEATVGQASCSIIQLLQHPDNKQRVLAELAQKLPYGTPIDHEVLCSLDHVAWAVRETERMYPAADVLLRTVEEDIEIGDYCVPAGWIVVISPGTAHRLPELFEGPHRYDPLRFAPGREEHRQDQFALIGFGGGMHKCAGMNFAVNEMMITVALLFQQFDLELATGSLKVEYEAGASRPRKVVVRYRRRHNLPLVTAERVVETVT
jgi:sterol 14-demethylase